jgi:hypothetical protein
MTVYDAKPLTTEGKVDKKSPSIIKGSGTFSGKNKRRLECISMKPTSLSETR